jgi:hypothetical protein
MCPCCPGCTDKGVSERCPRGPGRDATEPPVGPHLSLCCLQRCCHCCLLGRAAQARGQSCELSLVAGYQCGLAFRACCVKGRESADVAPGDIGDLHENGNSPSLPWWVVCQSGFTRMCVCKHVPWLSLLMGVTSVASTNHRWKISRKKNRIFTEHVQTILVIIP